MANNLTDIGYCAEIVNRSGASPIVLICEHASRHIPGVLNGLGLGPDALESHIAYDIGAEAVARKMSALLDAPLVLQKYSRLIYDCNRPPESASAMPEKTGGIAIPGNKNLSDTEKTLRIAQIYQPFHQAISELIASRRSRPDDPVIVTIHSFTRWLNGHERMLDLGVLHDDDPRLADAMLAQNLPDSSLVVERNQPYGPTDGVTHTLNKHRDGLMNVMLEVRNDLVDTAMGQQQWAAHLANLLQSATRSASHQNLTDNLQPIGKVG